TSERASVDRTDDSDESSEHASESSDDDHQAESENGENGSDSSERAEASRQTVTQNTVVHAPAAASSALQSVGSSRPSHLTAGGVLSNHYIIVLNNGAGSVSQTAQQMARQYGLTVDAIYNSSLQGFAATVPSARLRALTADPRVQYVEQDQLVAN